MEVREPAISYNKRKYSIEEYLEMENASTEKHEYYQGEIFAMSGAKMPHIKICGNLYFHLRLKLKDKPCTPYNSDARIFIESNSLFTYPDISIFCKEPISLNDDKLNFLNPTAIVEFLSPTTKEYNKNEKFTFYKSIPTLKEYILIDSESYNVENFYKDNYQGWVALNQHSNLNETINLKSIQASLNLSDIYEGVFF